MIDGLTSRAGMPLHSNRWYRRRIVSFGALTYYLRALFEVGATFDDERSDRLFREGVSRTLALQGRLGEWPWMIDTGSGRAVDTYPVFAVHQDSMAMLFLHPALDRSLPGVREAVDRSLGWSLGANELGVRMYADDPVFFAFRSIERRERAPRVRRYVRSTLSAVSGRPTEAVAPRRLRVNRECRSYHPGWILFAWSDRLAA